jgi:hypothetical protein
MKEAPPIKYNGFDCSGNGFTFESYSRATSSEIADALNAQYPLFANANDANTNTTPKRLRGWWEAQVRLYGLECAAWKVEEMKTVLRKALQKGELKVDDKLTKTEQSAMKHGISITLRFRNTSKRLNFNAVNIPNSHGPNRMPPRTRWRVFSTKSRPWAT